VGVAEIGRQWANAVPGPCLCDTNVIMFGTQSGDESRASVGHGWRKHRAVRSDGIGRKKSDGQFRRPNGCRRLDTKKCETSFSPKEAIPVLDIRAEDLLS